MSTSPVPQPDNFQYIKLPDGSYGKFAADATDDVIRSAISKDFPDAFPPQPQPESQQSAFVRLMTRATGLPVQDIINRPGSYLNPFNKDYQQEVATQRNMTPQQIAQQSADQPIMPGRQTYQDIKNKNYAGAFGDILPGSIAFLQMMAGARGAAEQPQIMPRQLPGAIGMPGEVEPSPAPYVAPTTRAQRLGLLLKQAQEPIPLQASSQATQPSEGLLPAARVQVPDRTSPTGFRDQFVTSVADPNQNLSLNQGRALRTPQSIDEFHQMLKAVQEMNAQEGAGSDIVDQRMAEYAKSPVDKMQMRTQLGKPQPVAGMDGLFDYPIIKNGQQIGQARISISGDQATVGAVAPVGYRPGGEPMELGAVDARALKTQFEADNPGVKLKWNPGSATNERALARVQRRLANAQQAPSVPAIGQFPAQQVNNSSDLTDLLMRSIQQARARK